MNSQVQLSKDSRDIDQRPGPRRARRYWLVTSLVALALISGNWLYSRSYTVRLDDARIASNIVSISSNRSGWITEFPAISGQRVDANTLLAKIDTRATELALRELDLQISAHQAKIQSAQANRALTEQRYLSEIQAQQARLANARASVNKVESEQQQAQSNFDRSSKLRQKS